VLVANGSVMLLRFNKISKKVQTVRFNKISKKAQTVLTASRFVKKLVRLNKVFTVAGTELSSNWDVAVGPLGSWMALPLETQGDISSDVSRLPSRLKSKSAHGARQGASSAGTPSKGGVTCDHQHRAAQQAARGIRAL